MSWRFAAICAAVVFATCVHGAANPAAVRALIDRMVADDAAVQGMAVSAVDATGFRMDGGAASGFASSDQSRGMEPHIAVRGGTVGELLLASVVVELMQSSVLPQADESIPSRFLPGGIIFVNPAFPGQPLTLRMLLTHTSSIRDTNAFDQNPSLVSQGSTAKPLQDFALEYFTTTASGTRAVVPGIWSADQPGLDASYRYARSNIALLSYVVQLALAENTALASVPTVGGLIQERVMNRLGLTSTYFILPDGRTPLTQTNLELLSAGKQTEPTTFPIHAAYVADYMCLTSAADMAKLFNALFIQQTGALRAVGAAMETSFRTLASVDTARGGVSQQGFGVVAFDAASLCGHWRAAGGTGLGCPFAAGRRVWGYTAESQAASLAVLCQANPLAIAAGTTSTSGSAQVSCTAATATRSTASSSPVSVTQPLSAAAESHQQLQATTLNSGATIAVVRPDDQQRSVGYGFTVAGVVVAIMFFVLVVSYLVEFIVRPLSVTGPVIAAAYPKLDDIMDDEDDEASPLRLAN